MTENDIGQLATFLGHTKEVHQQFYRLSESTFQVAKISKLLLMMEKGKGQEFRGKTLDEININVDTLVSDIEEAEEQELEEIEDIFDNNIKKNIHDNKLNKQVKIKNILKTNVKQHKFIRVPWSDEEKKVTTEAFKKHIIMKKAPRKEECEEIMKKYPHLFIDKTWKKIKTFIHNIYNSKT